MATDPIIMPVFFGQLDDRPSPLPSPAGRGRNAPSGLMNPYKPIVSVAVRTTYNWIETIVIEP